MKRFLLVIATAAVLALAAGCVTMSQAECKSQCASRGMVLKGIASTPTTAFRWAHDECICEPKPEPKR